MTDRARLPATPDRVGDWQITYSGRKFWPLDPRPEDIHFPDIWHQLSMISRWGGCVRHPWSVGQHTLLVGFIMKRHPEFRLWTDPERRAGVVMEALVHDAPEAYIGDMSRPMKHSPRMAEFRTVEERIHAAIDFRLQSFMPNPVEAKVAVKWADNLALRVEAEYALSRLVRSDHWDWTGTPKPGPADRADFERLADLNREAVRAHLATRFLVLTNGINP